jgi:hypothetical protein
MKRERPVCVERDKLAVSLALYGVVRAIGWVIGGFAA